MFARLPIPSEEKKTSDFLQTATFRKAMQNLPQCDIDLVKNKTTLSDENIAQMLVLNRWHNKICDTCKDKRVPEKLKHCGKCCLTFYCSVECQRKNWEEHRKRCAKKDGPLDLGPQTILFLHQDMLDMNESDLANAKTGQEIRLVSKEEHNKVIH